MRSPLIRSFSQLGSLDPDRPVVTLFSGGLDSIGKSGYQNLRNDRVRGMPLRGPAPHGHRPPGTN
ncbi:hypothetical protein [Streptomyces violaceus]|uniref:Uncharacterized protein n=1 Tax=Streptomyces violaceus TaxID=1936 RepID=A0ABZ1NQD2_STRVL